MKKKKQQQHVHRRKLQLRQETIRSLSTAKLAAVIGRGTDTCDPESDGESGCPDCIPT